MSLRYEQYRALLLVRGLLSDILIPKCAPKGRKALCERANTALHHFPPLTRHGRPLFSKDRESAEYDK